MKKLDSFILKAFIGPFFMILMIVIFVLLLDFLWIYIDEIVGKGLSFGIILEFLMWGTCTMLPTSLPLATLLAGMMTIGRMSESGELMAVKAAGISFKRIMIPLTITATIISIGAFFVGNNLVPKAFNEIFTLRDDIGKTNDEIRIPPGTFYDGIEGYILRIENQTDEGMMQNVMVYDHTGRKGNTSVTLADSARMKISKDKDYLIFSMYNGVNYQETNDKSYRDTTLQLEKIDFEKQELTIKLANYSFEKSDTARYSDQSKSMTLSQLKEEHDTLNARLAAAHDEAYNTVVKSRSIYKSSQLDTARRSYDAVFFNHKRFDGSTSKQLADDCEAAESAAVQISAEISSACLQINESNYFLRYTDLELLRKFAQALACIILFFVGAPLGALIRKGGIGISAIISVLFFLLYWVIDITGTKLAKDGTISPSVGIFTSAYVLIPVGIFLSWKAMNDAQIFSGMDSFKSNMRKIVSRIKGFFRPTRIVYMGTPEFAVTPLDNLIKKKYKVVGVVTVTDKPSGRGLKVNESAVKQYAVSHGIPVLQPIKLRDPEFLDALRALKADLFVVVAFRMLPEEVWKMPRLGTFNLHAALLPQYRGAAPINWAVINGEKLTGVTTFMLDHQIDTGGIIMRQECRIEPDDTAGTVHDKLMEIGTALVEDTVQSIIEGSVELRVQRSFIQGSEQLKPAPKLTKELCHIDWNDRSSHIFNLIRGLSPYPTAFTELVPCGQPDQSPVQLKIFKAEKCDLHAAPGTVLSDGKTYFAIATADGAISIKDLQLQGKKRMPVEDFLRGFRNPEEYVCTAGTSRETIETTLS